MKNFFILFLFFTSTGLGFAADKGWYNYPVHEKYYQISTIFEMEGLSEIVNSGYSFDGDTIELKANIDFKNSAFKTLSKFNGMILGKGYKFTNMTVPFCNELAGCMEELCIASGNISAKNYSSSDYRCGTFANILSGVIRNCTNYATITCGYDYTYIGGICGSATGLILNCKNYGNVECINPTSIMRSGGIAGYGNSCKIIGCYNKGAVKGTSNLESGVVGGIVGHIENGQIQYCFNDGTVSASASLSEKYQKAFSTGGITGYCQGGTMIDRCINAGNISNNGLLLGGICGLTGNANFYNCLNNGTVSSKASTIYTCVGGIIGCSDASKEYVACNLNNTGVVSATTNNGRTATSGGIAGSGTDNIQKFNWYSARESSSSSSGTNSHTFSGFLSSGISENLSQGLLNKNYDSGQQAALSKLNELVDNFNKECTDSPTLASWIDGITLDLGIFAYPEKITASAVTMGIYSKPGEEPGNIKMESVTSVSDKQEISTISFDGKSFLIKDLLPDTRYIYKISSVNKNGVISEYESFFTTSAVELLNTISCGVDHILVNATTNADGLQITEKGFEIKTTEEHNWTKAPITDNHFSHTFEKLKANSQYMIRSYILTKAGLFYSDISQVNTIQERALITSLDATCFSVELAGEYDVKLSEQVTDKYFIIKSSDVQQTIPYINDGANVKVTGLLPGHAYTAQFVVKTNQGEYVSDIRNFSTLSINTDLTLTISDTKITVDAFQSANLSEKEYSSKGISIVEDAQTSINKRLIEYMNTGLIIDGLCFAGIYIIKPYYVINSDTIFDQERRIQTSSKLLVKKPVISRADRHATYIDFYLSGFEPADVFSHLIYGIYDKTNNAYYPVDNKNLARVRNLKPNKNIMVDVYYKSPYDETVKTVNTSSSSYQTLDTEFITLTNAEVHHNSARVSGLGFTSYTPTVVTPYVEYRKLTDSPEIESNQKIMEMGKDTCYAIIPHDNDGTIWQYRVGYKKSGNNYYQDDWKTFTAHSADMSPIAPICITDTVLKQTNTIVLRGLAITGSVSIREKGFELGITGLNSSEMIIKNDALNYALSTIVPGYLYYYRVYVVTEDNKNYYGPVLYFNSEGQNFETAINQATEISYTSPIVYMQGDNLIVNCKQDGVIQVWGLDGKLLKSANFISGENQIPLNHLNATMYIVHLKVNEKTFNFKIPGYGRNSFH